MSTIVLRSTKGSALTFAEGDANFSNLNTDKLEDITNESIGDLSDVDISSLTNGYVLTYNSTSGNLELQAAAGGASVLNDLSDVTITTPTTGDYLYYGATGWQNQALSVNLNTLTDVSVTTPSDNSLLQYDSGTTTWYASNQIDSLDLRGYKETVYSLGSTDSPTINVANGNVQSVTITSGLSLPAFTSASTGQSVTLLVSGSGTASGTAAYKFAGGNTTLTTSSVVSIFYDGTTYWASIATDFQ